METIDTVRAECRRCDGRWAVGAPAIPGLHTQARRLCEVPDMVRDAARLLDVRVGRVDCIIMKDAA